MSSYSEIKTGLMWVLQQISPANGFVNTVGSTHIRGLYDGPWIDDKNDSLYPKVMVVLDAGELQQLASYQQHRIIHFLIFVFVKKLQAGQEPVSMTESFIADIEKALFDHSSLNGTVNNARVVSFITDGGVLTPEGCAILKVETLST